MTRKSAAQVAFGVGDTLFWDYRMHRPSLHRKSWRRLRKICALVTEPQNPKCRPQERNSPVEVQELCGRIPWTACSDWIDCPIGVERNVNEVL